MAAQLIDGKIVSEKVRAGVAAAVARLPGKPCLAVVLVGDDAASALYVKSKGEKTEAAGMRSITKRYPASASQDGDRGGAAGAEC
jgi:methylenetetrahydrofolate dehydrogenase (NADP+)/methenyltetrahydrofolate cyclohydrolase